MTHSPAPARGLRIVRALTTCLVVGALTAPLAAPLSAQDAAAADARRQLLDLEEWTRPSDRVSEAVLAPRWQNVSGSNLSPDGQWFVHSLSDGPPSMADFAVPHLNLGALQIDPAANRARSLTTRGASGLEVVSTVDGRQVRIQTPANARISGATWSPDGSQLAFMASLPEATHLWVWDAASGRSRQLSREPLLAVHVTSPEWTTDGREVAVVLPPQGRGPMPTEASVPTAPMVRRTTDVENSLRTYFDLLESPHEKALVRWFSTGQLSLIDVASRRVTRVGEPAMILDVDASPDGQHFRVRMFAGDFSYIVPTMSSATREELWDRSGAMLAMIAETAAREGAQDDGDDDAEGGEEDRRGLAWHPTASGLVYLQMEARPAAAGDSATAGGDAAAADSAAAGSRSGARHDRLVHWMPPFDTGSTTVLYESRQRMNSVAFDRDGGTIFITRGSGGNSGTSTVHAVRLDAADEEHLVVRRSGSDITKDPGSLMFTTNARGVRVVRTSSDGSATYLSGTQYFENPVEQAPRPFVDRVTIATAEKERVFESSADRYEQVSAALDDDMNVIVVSRESPTEVEQLFRIERAAGSERQITSNVDHTPELTGARREMITITRPDGFTSRVRVTLPVGWTEGDPAPPAMFWFYPREYSEQEQFDQQTLGRYNRNQFRNLGSRSMDILALEGYAVVDPDLPIVGGNGQMNDNYVQDLRNTLAVVIDSLADRGWADRKRLGLGGHSYGAFGTVNAMVHTPFFKAGIAGDGNYNRTLTPAGFQSERRTLWEAEQVYLEMSPTLYAERLTGALLMYHGMDDHNVGTHPDHSRRLFHALNVLGKNASLYMYPFEDHGPATRETLLDLWARWTAWLDTYVKGDAAAPRAVTFEDDGAAPAAR